MRRQSAVRRSRDVILYMTLALILGLLTTSCGQASQPGPQGTIGGDVVAGPTCPVERAGTPCPPQPVTNRQVTIETPEDKAIAQTTTDANGHFSVQVPPGRYVVRVLTGPGMVGLRQITPGQVTVTAGQTTYIRIELDTGIR